MFANCYHGNLSVTMFVNAIIANLCIIKLCKVGFQRPQMVAGEFKDFHCRFFVGILLRNLANNVSVLSTKVH